MVLSMIRVFSYSLGERSFFISSLISSKQLFFVSGRISPQVLRCCHKPATSLFVSLLIFQQLCSILLCKDAFQVHLWQKLAFSSPFCYSNDISSILSSEGVVMWLFSLIISNCEDRVLFMLIHLIRESCPLFKSSLSVKFCIPSQPECCLKSFLPLVPFFQLFRTQSVDHFVKYPLILSNSCSIPSIYSRNAVQIISFLILLYLVLTGVVSIYILPFNLTVFAMFILPLF